jgi:hypothetical protein
MKKTLFFLVLLITIISSTNSKAQIVCIYCYEQNDSISSFVNNLLVNGSFENNNCIPNNWFTSSYCPNSSYYTCDITGWTATGGGSNTYADIININYANVVEGTFATYFGNSYCHACSTTPEDTSCLVDTGCAVTGIPSGFPYNDAVYGGAQGLSLEQTVNGLNIGSTYILEFWAGGEANQYYPGLFAVDIGFGYTFFRNNPTPSGTGIGTRIIIEFNATATSHTIKFTNWGHICSLCTELILDDVRLYTVQELSPIVPPCAGATVNAIFSAPNQICPGTCTDFTNLSTNATSFVWSFPGSSTPVSTDVNPMNICYNSPGSYSVTLIASNVTSADTLTLNNYITVYPSPPAQGILQSGDTLIANQGSMNYQWFFNGSLISGATDYFYVAPQSGNYSVVASDENNCEVEAVINNVIANSQLATGNSQLAINPNPVVDILEIQNLKTAEKISFTIYNTLGSAVKLPTAIPIAIGSQLPTCSLNVSDLPPGCYILEITSDKKIYRTKFLKQ